MSCPHSPANNPLHDGRDANVTISSNSSDYGSEFSPCEADLLNKLLAEVDVTVRAETIVTPQPSPSKTPTPAVRDIEDCYNNEEPSSDRVPRVLGREKPAWQIRKSGARANQTHHIAGHSLPAFGNILHPRCYLLSPPQTVVNAADITDVRKTDILNTKRLVEHPDSTEGRDRDRERNIARERTWAGNAETATDPRSPVERFRRPPNKAFSVTDLVSPAWCEIQYWYTLTKFGRKRRTPAMKQGSTIHKTLEDEIYTTVSVEITTKEDAFALRIWNVIQGLRTLREYGITRELEIWGMVDGELVNGVIDQLSYECPDLDLEASAASHYADVAASRAIMPEYQMSLTEYLLSPSQGGKRLSDLSHRDEPLQIQEETTSSQSSNELPSLARIYMTDVKTRASKSIPTVKSSSFRPTMLQLQLYYHMLNRLVTSDDVTIESLAFRYELDPERSFTDPFISEIGSLNDQFFDALSSLEFDPDFIPIPEDAITRGHVSSQGTQNTNGTDFSASNLPPTASQDSTSVLLAHNNLTRLWKLMKDQLRLTFLPKSQTSISVAPSIPSEFQPPMLESYATVLSPLLTAQYLSSAPTADLRSRVLGSRSFLFDPASLTAYMSDQMEWWRGQRDPRGVEVMEAWKCRICEFQDECSWRQEREWYYAKRKKGEKPPDDLAT